MFDKINTISDMLRNHIMEEKKPTNPSIIANQHRDIDNVPSSIPFRSKQTRLKARLTPNVATESNEADNLSTETIVEITTSDGNKKNILGLLDTGAI
eukprot:10761102-Ditylum_brightwellii.AAC.1